MPSALEQAATAAATPVADDGTEAALAEALAGSDLHRKLRWNRTAQPPCWSTWDGRRWADTADKVPLVLLVAIRRALASGLEGRTVDAKAISRLESRAGMAGIGGLLSAWPSMLLPDEVDPPGLVAMPAGVLDLATGEHLEHDPARPITKCLPVDPGPATDLWRPIEEHLRACLGSQYTPIQRFLGSALLGRGADRKLVWLHGPGGDGKSTFAKLLRYALGEHLATVEAEVFQGSSRGGAHIHELGSVLAGARLAVALEVEGNLAWAKIKGLSGGDEQTTKRSHGRRFTYERPPCLLLISNDPPMPPDRACAERVIVGRMSPPVDPDERIMEVLKDGGPERDALAGACLTWLLAGCSEYLEHGLGPVQTAHRAAASLEGWWDQRVAEGGIVAGKGWSPLDVFSADLAAFLEPTGGEVPRSNELSAFLRGKVPFKRTKAARLYQAEVTPGDASPLSSSTYREKKKEASPGVTSTETDPTEAEERLAIQGEPPSCHKSDQELADDALAAAGML